jgi:DnaJ-class molecular chaperone
MDDEHELPDELNAQGFWLHTEHGPAHVLGDANMSEKTLGLIKQLIEAVQTKGTTMKRTCEKCGGEGFIPHEGRFLAACLACDGNGYAYDWERIIKCPDCEEGRVLVDEDHGGIYRRCESCDGNGNYTERGYNEDPDERAGA